MKQFLTLLLLFATLETVRAQRFVRTIDTLASLVASNPNNVDTNVTLIGYTSTNDNGGGSFFWQSGNTSATNYGTVFASAHASAGTGRWVRQTDGNVVQGAWFGISSNIVDNADRLTSLSTYVASLQGGAIMELPPGNIAFASTWVLPNARAKIGIRGARRLGTRLVWNGTSTYAITATSSSSGGSAYLLEDFLLTSEGNAASTHGLLIAGDGNRDLYMSRVRIGQFANGVGLTIDGLHTVTLDTLLVDYCSIPYSFGPTNFFNAANLNALSAENNTSVTAGGGRIANSVTLNWMGGTVEANSGPIFITNSIAIHIQGIHFEDNLGTNGSVLVQGSKAVTIEDCLFDADDSATSRGIIFGHNTFAGLGHSYASHNNHFQFIRTAIVLGYDGTGPIAPTSDADVFFGVTTNFHFAASLAGGYLAAQFNGAHYYYNTAGTIVSTIGTSVNGSDTTFLDLGGQTSSLFQLPRIPDGTFAFLTPNSSGGALALNDTTKRLRWYNGTLWQNVGTGDGNVVVTGTGTNNYHPKWSSGELSTGSLIYDDATTVGINTGSSPSSRAKLHAKDGSAGFTPTPTSATLIVENNGSSSNAATIVLMSLAGESLIGRNSGTIGLPLVGAGKLLRSDASSNIAEVAVAAGLTWDGTTLGIATNSSGSNSNAYTTVMNSETPVSQRTNLNFWGSGFLAADNSASNRTDVTLDSDLNALATNTTSGMYARTAAGSGTGRTITGGSGISVSNGDGTSGNPTISLTTAAATINPTTGRIPVRISATAFGDSPVAVSSTNQVYQDYRAADEFGPTLLLLKQGRTGSATNTPISTAALGTIGFGGWTGAADSYVQSIRGIATENWALASQGNRLDFYTTPNGTATQTLGLRIGQDGKINIPQLAANNYLGVDGSNNLVITNAPSSSATASSFSIVGTGADYLFAAAPDFEKITFGTTGPSFIITNAGTYAITIKLAAFAHNTFAQHYFVTNVTDHVKIPGSNTQVLPPAEDEGLAVPFVFQITTSGSNRVLELWGATDDTTYSGNPAVIATNSIVSVIKLQ